MKQITNSEVKTDPVVDPKLEVKHDLAGLSSRVMKHRSHNSHNIRQTDQPCSMNKDLKWCHEVLVCHLQKQQSSSAQSLP